MAQGACVAPLVPMLVALAVGSGSAATREYDAREFGAVADGKTLATRAIQSAIDRCTAEGGGRVVLAGGAFLSGALALKSNVTLHVEAGAVLRGSLDKADYPDIVPQVPFLYRPRFTRQLIHAERQSNIAITGRGTIDGQGTHEAYDARKHKGDTDRPYILRFAECANVALRDITLLESPRWCAHLLACEDVTIDGVTIRSTVRENRDGLDIDSCDRVRVSNCRIETGDDAIVLKSTTRRPCRNVTVTNCHLSSQAAAFKLGTESNGGFQNIVMSNSTLYDTGGAGISLLMVDGGTLDGVAVSNVVMENVFSPIFIRLGNRARPLPGEEPPGVGTLRNIVISGVQARGAGPLGCALSGIPGHPIEGLTLRDIRLEFAGGGTAEDARAALPEREAAYPAPRMFGPRLPAYGFFIRHVRDLTLDGLGVSFERAAGEARPALVLDDVLDANLTKLRATAAGQAPTLRLVNCQGVLLHGCRVAEPQGPFVAIAGERSRDIAILGNDLRKAQPPAAVEQAVPQGAVWTQ